MHVRMYIYTSVEDYVLIDTGSAAETQDSCSRIKSPWLVLNPEARNRNAKHAVYSGSYQAAG